MTRDEVVQALSAWIRVEYGKLLALREVRRVRRAAGTTWLAKIVVPASKGEVPIGQLEIDEEGNILNAITIDQVIEAIRKPEEAASGFDDMPEGLGDLLDMGEPESRLDEDLEKLDPNKLYLKAAALASAADEPSLRQARDLMPRLLSDPEKRAAVLVWMAVVERKLNNIALALQHLEAAAREFADRFDLPALEKLAALSKELMAEGYETSPIKRLLDESREKMRPVKTIFECPQFLNLSSDDQDWLAESMKIRELKVGADLVREGEPSRNVFVIKSGLVGVHLEKPEGGTRLVRTCYPGWLLGESSVLVSDDPRCTATLRAEKPSEVWVIDAGILKEIMAENPDVKYRIEATKHLHRIDSFFSMHETLAQLEAIVRDDLLACIQRIATFESDTTIIPANEPPKIACLILKGELAMYEGEPQGEALAVIPADRFLGVRDAMHQIAPATSAVARAGSHIAFFDAEMLRALGERSAENVVAVLERLG